MRTAEYNKFKSHILEYMDKQELAEAVKAMGYTIEKKSKGYNFRSIFAISKADMLEAVDKLFDYLDNNFTTRYAGTDSEGVSYNSIVKREQ